MFLPPLTSNTENVLDAEGSSPLHLAVINDNPQCVKLLLNHRADINISKCAVLIHSPVHTISWFAENSAGQTALDIAVERKYDECIELVSDPRQFCSVGLSLLLSVARRCQEQVQQV